MKIRLLLALPLLNALMVPAIAEEGVSFAHKEWELACDNTLTCRAAGYSAEEGARRARARKRAQGERCG